MFIKTKTLNLSGLLTIGLIALAHRECVANGISNFEGVECVSVALDFGADEMKCADDELPSCATPDWFPEGPVGSLIAGIDQMTSYGLDTSTRYNQVNYSAGSYISWEHDWYSSIDTPYGPALPSAGHLWIEYNGSTLVKSVSCNEHGTVSYP